MIPGHSGPHSPRSDRPTDRPFQRQECQERLGSLREQHAHAFLVKPEPVEHGDAKMRPVLPLGYLPIGSDTVAAGTIRHSGPPPLTRGLVA